MDATLEHGSSVRPIIAPEDCTEAAGLRQMVLEVRRALEQGWNEPSIDLSRVRRMNARLLATVLLMIREVSRAGGQLRLHGATDEFRRWARIFKVLPTLERRGVMI